MGPNLQVRATSPQVAYRPDPEIAELPSLLAIEGTAKVGASRVVK